MPHFWEITGGADKGGILVREGVQLASKACKERLSTGARVEELELINTGMQGDRLHFKRVAGTGPDEGWISVAISGRELAKRIQNWAPGGLASDDKLDWDPYRILEVPPEATNAEIKSAYRKKSLRVHPDHNPDPDAAVQFKRLTDAKAYLLNPVKRMIYNARHGVALASERPQWWSDWDDMFAELEPPEDDEALAASPALAAPLAEDIRTDILIFGATGFVGALICMLMPQFNSGGFTWAIAGRDQRKLRLVEERYGIGANFRGAVCIESPEDIEGLVRTARIVVDVSGPKFLMGGIVAEACVRARTHYIENSGYPADVLFAKQTRDRLDRSAKAAGVALCFFAGWVAVQVDFGVWAIVKHLREKCKVPTLCVDVYEAMQGLVVSGTSLLAFTGPEGFEAEWKAYGGSFCLGGVPVDGPHEQKPMVKLDDTSGQWVLPGDPVWIGSVGELVVARCSSALFAESSSPYGGSNFEVNQWKMFENQHFANGAKVNNMLLRKNYHKAVEDGKIPRPGQGAQERIRKECGKTNIIVAEADEPARRKAHLVLCAGPGLADPNEGCAHVILQAALSLIHALDSGQEGVVKAGFGTPTYHLAHLGFWERLQMTGLLAHIMDGPPSQDLFKASFSVAKMLQQQQAIKDLG